MENKEQGQGIAPVIQQAENVSYDQEVKDSHIDMNPPRGAEAEAMAKQTGQSIVAEPNVAQVVEPLTGSAVVVEPKSEVPDNGFPIGYGPNEHMKKIEKPKNPSLHERWKHARKKMSKKQKILMITIPSATVLVIGGLVIYGIVTGAFKVDYSGTYFAAKELRNEMQKLRSDASCDKVVEYVSNRYTANDTFNKYIEDCKVVSEGIDDSIVQKVGDTAGVLRDEEVRRRYETLKTAIAAAKEGNKDVNETLNKYSVWHEWIKAESSGDQAYAESWSDADMKKVSNILVESNVKEFQEYGKKWYEMKKAAADAANAYYHHEASEVNLNELHAMLKQKIQEFEDFKKNEEPEISELYPLELVDTAKLYAKFEEFYNYIRETYQKNYNSKVGGCKEYVSGPVCE